MSANQTGNGSVAAQAQEKAQQTVQQATQSAAKYVRDQTETRGRQMADELQGIADALQRSRHALHADGNTTGARAVEAVIERMEGLSRYLGGSGGDKMLRDLEAFGRRKPWGMIGLGLGLGLAASRFLKASSSRRIHEQPAVAAPPTPPAADQRVTGEIPVTTVRSA